MSLSLPNKNIDLETGDRRLFPRKVLPQIVLVFFGRNGFGRLVNLSEDGMAFEFSGLSDTGQVISFELVDLAKNRIQVDGRVIWARQLDKVAGMQFVDLSAENKEQIKQWLATGKFSGTRAHDESRRQIGESKTIEPLPTPAEPPPTHDESRRQVSVSKPIQALPTPADPSPTLDVVPTTPNLAIRQANVGRPQWHSEREERKSEELSRKTEEAVSRKIEEQPEPIADRDPNLQAWDAYYDRAHVGVDRQPISWWRIGVGFVIFLVLGAGIWVVRSRQSPADGVPRNSRKTTNSSALSQRGQSSVNTTARPFEVEVVDAKDRRWFLTFAGGLDTRAVPSAPRAASATSAVPAAVVRQSQTAASKNARDATAKTPEPRGQIEPARLLSSVSPAYPALAQSQNITGDVVIDALIDPTGKVTETKAVSGPMLLRDSAMETVRMWKYSPARLDGQPVSVHLQVTVRYTKQ
jgi:TonB family protein